MRSLVRAVSDRAAGSTVPVPFTSRSFSLPLVQRNDAAAQMTAMGSVGVLFAIVDRCATATASVEWKLWRKAKSGKKEDRVEVTIHPALTVWNSPNAFTTRQELVEAGQQHHDLTGEAWLVIGRDPRSTLPLELWVIRPDRIAPKPHAEKFIEEYTYLGPDGTKVPLGLNEVIFIRRPNPVDPYRGMGPVQSVLNHLDGEYYSAQWNRNFFLNGAEPGGIIEVDKQLSDPEFDRMTARWQQQHKGVANAHRVAVLEQAKYVDRKFAQKDMQFTELSTLSDEKVRRAFGFPKPMLGDTEDSNRAVAQAAEYVFARWLVVPRLERWKQALNNDFLPLFGSIGEGLEFDYISPVPEDEEAENAERDSKVDAATKMITAGFAPAEVLDWLELPALTYSEPAPSSPPPGSGAGSEPAPPVPDGATAARLLAILERVTGAREHRDGHGGHRQRGGEPDDGEPWRAVAEPPDPPDGIRPKLPDDVGPDLTPVQDSWESALEDLLDRWVELDDVWRETILDAIERHVDDGDLVALSTITVDSTDAAAELEAAMLALGADAADQVVAEAEEQDLSEELEPVSLDVVRTAATAQVFAALLAGILVGSATGEALRVWQPGMTGAQVRELVASHLEDLTDAAPRLYLGGALTQAQHDGRLGTIAAGPSAALYADEVLDTNTCKPCRDINRKWIGNEGDAMVLATYPVQGYVDCLGRMRCRGQVVPIWRGGKDWKKWVELPEQRKG